MLKLRKLFRFAILAVLCLGLAGLLASSSGLPDAPKDSFPPDPSLAEARSIRLTVTEEGIYRVRLADLGWENRDLTTLQLDHRNDPQPIWLDGQGADASIYFYGQPSDSIYTAENAYLLRFSDQPGLRMSENPAASGAGQPTRQVIVTRHLEENQNYNPLVESGDHWLWEKLIAPQSRNFELDLARVAPGDGKIRLALWGNTKAPADPDHHVRVQINGTPVADESWDGQVRHTIEAKIPAGTLQEGANTITVELPGDTASVIEIVFLDWLEIDYPRLSEAEDDRLIFTAGEDSVTLAGFSKSPAIFDVTHPEQVARAQLNGETHSFQGESGHRYIAAGPGGFLRPNGLYPSQIEPDLRSPEAGAEVLAIGPADLLAPLEPLLEWRQSQNLSTRSIPVQAVYDQFNGGMPEPQAIRQFLAYARAQWNPAPKYVLLVGDASYDYWGYTEPSQPNRLPALMVSTVFGGITGSDAALAQIDEDPWPDLAIGRIPAQTAEEVGVFVAKTLSYERQPFDAGWQRRILAVGDGQETRFKTDAQDFLDHFPPDFSTELIAPQAGESSSAEVVDAIQAGDLLTAYFGHGSLNMWGKDRIFTTDDSVNLKNGERLPIMLHITCLTGYFIHPSEPSLAETLLWNPEGGAVAILAPTSLTLPDAQGYLTSAFAEKLLESPDQRLGDILLAAWRAVPLDESNAQDVMNTFLLFGDPALKLP